MITNVFTTGDLYVDLVALLFASLSTGAILAFFCIFFMLIFRRKRSRSRLYE